MATAGFCLNCGAARVPGAMFCPSCGQRLPADADPVAGALISPAQPADVVTRSKRRFGIAELLVIVAIIGAILGGGYLILRQNVATILSNVGASIEATPATAVVSPQCKDQLSDLSDALFELDSRLSVGMNFSAYSDKVAGAKVAYDKVPIASLDNNCLTQVGTPEEQALNEYLAAYNRWNTCVGDVNCKNDSITAELQGHWSKATTLLTGVKTKLP